MKVIIIEDELLIARATKMQLESNGFEILGMGRNEESFLELIEFNPDAILMDISLKDGENGVEIIKKYRARGYQTSVIFTTGNSRELTRKEIANLEHACFLSKPVVYDELFQRIRDCCAR